MKISVIMPTLNSIEHIESALDGLISQTFKDFELLSVDSGSIDDTINILREHAQKDLRIKIIPTADITPALARNIGIENASGDYIAFCDSDDAMKPNMLETLYETALIDNADIVICDFDMEYPHHTVSNFSKISDACFQLSDDNILEYYYKFCAAPKPNNYIWSRLYKRRFLEDNNIRFQNVRYSEDHLLNLSTLFKTPMITHLEQSLYRYIQHDDSAMRRHIKSTNHGSLFLEGFRAATETLASKPNDISEPILAIYAYTRIKSILFYAWQAKLRDEQTEQAVLVFTSDADVKKHIEMCLRRGYINHYCRIHDLHSRFEDTICQMLQACLDNTALPDMSEVFS